MGVYREYYYSWEGANMLAIKRLSAAFAAATLVLVGVFAITAPAHAASGYVVCTTGDVVGVWAHRSGRGNTNSYSYDTQGKRWRVKVGCGGTPQRWAQSISSDWSTRQGSATINCADVGYIRTCRIG